MQIIKTNLEHNTSAWLSYIWTFTITKTIGAATYGSSEYRECKGERGISVLVLNIAECSHNKAHAAVQIFTAQPWRQYSPPLESRAACGG